MKIKVSEIEHNKSVQRHTEESDFGSQMKFGEGNRETSSEKQQLLEPKNYED